MRARTLLLFGSLALSPMLILLEAEPGSAGQSGISPAGIIATLNAERRANGIPAGVHLKSTWSARCRKHDVYMDDNRELTHYEQQGNPGYTKGGAWAG